MIARFGSRTGKRGGSTAKPLKTRYAGSVRKTASESAQCRNGLPDSDAVRPRWAKILLLEPNSRLAEARVLLFPSKAKVRARFRILERSFCVRTGRAPQAHNRPPFRDANKR